MTSPPEQELLTNLGVDYSHNKQVLDLIEHNDLGEMRDYFFAQPQWRLNKMCHFVENHDEPRAALALGGPPQSGSGWRLTAWRWEHNGEKRLVVFNWSDQQGWGGVQAADAYSRDGSDNIQLTDLLTGETFDRSASEMRGSGLFVGLAPWQAHIFTY